MVGDTSIQRKLSTIQKLEHLGRVDVFSDLGPNELLLLSNQCTEQDFAAGDVIFTEGEPASDIYALLDGSVELRRSSGQSTIIQERQTFGILSVLGNQPRMFSAVAKEDCQCLKLERDALWDIMEDYPALAHGIFKVMAQRVGSLLTPAEATIKG